MSRRHEEPLLDALSGLVAAVSILERAYEEKKAPNMVVGSNMMFEQMLDDYRASINRVHASLNAPKPLKSWLFYADKAPSDRNVFADLNGALTGAEIFLVEAESLKLEVNRFKALQKRVQDARDAYLDAGGTLGGFNEGVFHEPSGDPELMREFIDRQTLLRLHVCGMLDERDVARAEKAAKDAAKAAKE
jgi:hypothetical protein